MTETIDLQIPFSNTSWHHALSIPINDCHYHRFTTRPPSWLRYVASTIAAGAKGHISASRDGPPVDYDTAQIRPGTYYYVTQSDDAQTLLDPDLMHDTNTVSDLACISISPKQEDEVIHKIQARDGACMMINDARNCLPFYFVPHSKGDQYMINLIQHWNSNKTDSSDTNPPLALSTNGILLHTAFHNPFRASSVAISKRPISPWASTTSPASPNPPGIGFKDTHPPNAPVSSRLTFQHFDEYVDSFTAWGTPHNSDARPRPSVTKPDSNSDSSHGVGGRGAEWPPAMIFDVAYGCAALHAWGVPAFIEFAPKRVADSYYYDDDDEEGLVRGVSGIVIV